MKEVPYETDHDVRARSNTRNLYDRMEDFLARRGGGSRGGNMSNRMDNRNRIGYRNYDTYDTYNRNRNRRGYDDDERMLLMQMMGISDNFNEHFDERTAKETVEEMYHVKDHKKYIGEKYDMRKAREVFENYKHKLEGEADIADVYVAINSQYHDYCELFEKWFGKGNFDDMIIESAICFWFNDVDFGEDKVWKYFNELN